MRAAFAWSFLVVIFIGACSNPSDEWQRDLRRARTRVPGDAYRGSTAAAAAAALNRHLLRVPNLQTQACDSFDVASLRGVLQRLHVLTEPKLMELYQQAKDPRQQTSSSLETLQEEWAAVDVHLNAAGAALLPMMRDGLCHEAVMRFVHHLATPAQRSVAASADFMLPLLPPKLHTLPGMESTAADPVVASRQAVFKNYKSKVSCQQCHSGVVTGDASLPPPLPVDKEHPGLERLRSCDYQNSPACGPCEGLGGPRTGDGVHEFEPIHCEIVGMPDQIDVEQRVNPVYPMKAKASMVGDVRWPLVLIPDGTGKYFLEIINVSWGWDGQMARMRYDFAQPEQAAGMSQTYLQTYAQMKAAETTGATITVTADGKCTCDESGAGVLHVHAFAPHDEWDVINLPASEGGTAYLGRVKISPLDDGIGKRVVEADHYLKYGFHFLVESNKSSKSFGLPLRTYIPFGVRQVFTSWDLTDPALANPNLWKMPKNCKFLNPVCKAFVEDDIETPVIAV